MLSHKHSSNRFYKIKIADRNLVPIIYDLDSSRTFYRRFCSFSKGIRMMFYVIKITKSIKPYRFRRVKYRHSTTRNRCEHLLSNTFVTAPPCLNKFFLYFEQTLRFKLSFMKFLSQKHKKFSIFCLVSNNKSISLVDNHTTLN